VPTAAGFNKVMSSNIYHNLCSRIDFGMELLLQLSQSLCRDVSNRRPEPYRAHPKARDLLSHPDSGPLCLCRWMQVDGKRKMTSAIEEFTGSMEVDDAGEDVGKLGAEPCFLKTSMDEPQFKVIDYVICSPRFIIIARIITSMKCNTRVCIRRLHNGRVTHAELLCGS
jgi:hypothetical protein